MRSRRWLRLAWGLAIVAVLLLLVRTFLADFYLVDTGSMRPTIFGGRARPDAPELDEWVLVTYQRNPALERFGFVVVRSPGGKAPLVKRVAGLPGEELRIVDGDLLVNGTRLPIDHPRPQPVTVFDDRHQSVADFFEYKRAPVGEAGPWHNEQKIWYLDAFAIPPGSNAGSMLYHPDLRDDYLDRNGDRQAGLRQVNDGVFECEVNIQQALPGGVVRFRLVEEGDSFEVELAGFGVPDEPPVMRLVRWNGETLMEELPENKRQVLAQVSSEIPFDHWFALRFSNVDNHLMFELPEHGVRLQHSYEENVPFRGRKPAGQKSLGHRLAFGGEGVRAAFRSVRVLRDLYYTRAGKYAVDRSVTLASNEVFLLGDNSASSTDSRHFGPVDVRQLVGCPLAIVWPSFRWLRATDSP